MRTENPYEANLFFLPVLVRRKLPPGPFFGDTPLIVLPLANFVLNPAVPKAKTYLNPI